MHPLGFKESHLNMAVHRITNKNGIRKTQLDYFSTYGAGLW